MKNVDKFVFAARASSGVAMVFAMTWIFNSFVCAS